MLHELHAVRVQEMETPPTTTIGRSTVMRSGAQSVYLRVHSGMGSRREEPLQQSMFFPPLPSNHTHTHRSENTHL